MLGDSLYDLHFCIQRVQQEKEPVLNGKERSMNKFFDYLETDLPDCIIRELLSYIRRFAAALIC